MLSFIKEIKKTISQAHTHERYPFHYKDEIYLMSGTRGINGVVADLWESEVQKQKDIKYLLKEISFIHSKYQENYCEECKHSRKCTVVLKYGTTCIYKGDSL